MVTLHHGWQTRYSSRGHAYQVWARDMPWIDDTCLESVVYLYHDEAAAYAGKRAGGSGFLIAEQLYANVRLLLIVTNKHVIDDGAMVARINTTDGKIDVIPLDHATWIPHPNGDDIAICPISGLNRQHKCRSLGRNLFMSKDMIDGLKIGPGDDVFIAGRFISHEGIQRNLPSVRFGCIAQMPWEPIIREDGFEQEAFLVEARSISGYSGSPVFWYAMGTPALPKMKDVDLTFSYPMINPVRANLQLPIGPYLLGISYCHMIARDKIYSGTTHEPLYDWYVKANTGMMGVIPIWKLADLIDGDAMKPLMDEAKAEAREFIEKHGGQAVPDVASEEASPPASDENPTHREDFTALLNAAAKTPPRDD